MSRPALRKQLALPLLAAAVFGLALYLLHKISGEPLTAQAMTDPQNPLQWAMRLVSIAFWLGAAFAADEVRVVIPAARDAPGRSRSNPRRLRMRRA